MNVLVLEDRGSVSFYLEEALVAEGHEVFAAFNINDARSLFEDKPIDCIIEDLNMSPDGLEPKEIKMTQSGILTGWIWLREHVLKKKDWMSNRTIIYSEYLPQLREYASEKDLRGIRTVAKRGSTNPTKELLGYVREIAKTVKRKEER